MTDPEDKSPASEPAPSRPETEAPSEAKSAKGEPAADDEATTQSPEQLTEGTKPSARPATNLEAGKESESKGSVALEANSKRGKPKARVPKKQAASSTQTHPASKDGPPKSDASDRKSRRAKHKKPRRARSDKRLGWQELDAAGRERPRFLASFPDEPELNQLVQAFERGNYNYVRENAAKLADKHADPAVQRAALELLERIKPDPLMRYVLAASVLLLVYLIVEAYAH